VIIQNKKFFRFAYQWLWIFILSQALGTDIFAQSQEIIRAPKTKHLSTLNGLPQAQVSSMYSDSKGYLWIGTKNGLARYDGHEIFAFPKLNNHTNFVTNVLEAPNKEGIFVVNTSNKFNVNFIKGNLRIVYDFQEMQDIKMIYYSIQPTFFDSSLIMITYNYEDEPLMVRLNYKTSRVHTILFPKDYECLYLSGENAWFRPISGEYQGKILKYRGKEIVSVFKDTFLTLQESKEYFHWFEIRNNELVLDTIKNPYLGSHDYVANNKSYLIVNSFKNKSTYLYDKATKSWQTYLTKTLATHAIKDKWDNLYIGTEQGVFSYGQAIFKTINFNKNLDFDDIWSMTSTLDKTFYFASFTKGIFKSKDLKQYQLLDLKQTHSRGSYGMIANKLGDVFLSDFGSQKFSFVVDNQIKQYPFRSKAEFFGSYVEEDQDIIFNDFYTIYRFEAQSKNVSLLYNKSQDSICSAFLDVSPFNQKIISGIGKKLIQIDSLGNSSFFDSLPFSLRTLYTDEHQTLWVGMSENIRGYLPNGEKIDIDVKINEFVFAMIKYKKWLILGLENHLLFVDMDTYMNSKQLKTILFDLKEQAEIFEGNQNSFHIVDSTLYWPCMNTILEVDLEKALSTTQKEIHPQILSIISLEVNKNVFLDPYAQELVLGPNQRNLKFILSAPFFESHKKINYRYRLCPEDEWIYITSNDFFLFNLEPKAYSLQIEASIDGVNWTPLSNIPKLNVKKLGYEHYGFMFLFICGIIIFALLINKELLKKQNENYLKKLQTAQDLNNLKVQVLKSKYIPHFTFNATTNINYLIRKGEYKLASRYLIDMADLHRIALISHDNMMNSIETELNFIRKYLSIENLRFEKLQYKIIIRSNTPLSFEIPGLCIHTLVENALKHGLNHLPEDKSWELKIYIGQFKNNLIISVTDNGVGRKESVKYSQHSSGTGLKVLQQQIEILKENKKLYSEIYYTDFEEVKPYTGTRAYLIITK
jgi:hypothetical protein